MKAPIELQNLPMLLERYYPGAMQFPVWVERKYNGVRCVIVVDCVGRSEAYSREGRVLAAGARAATEVAERCGPGYYDGELVGPSFRATLSAVKRKDPATLRYKCWERIHEYLPGSIANAAPLIRRKVGLVGLMRAPWVDASAQCVDLVPGGWAWSEEELGKMLDLAIRRGWEGLVIKDPAGWYRFGVRSKAWMKLRPKGEE